MAPRGRTPCDLIGRFQVNRYGCALLVTVQMMCKRTPSCSCVAFPWVIREFSRQETVNLGGVREPGVSVNRGPTWGRVFIPRWAMASGGPGAMGSWTFPGWSAPSPWGPCLGHPPCPGSCAGCSAQLPAPTVMLTVPSPGPLCHSCPRLCIAPHRPGPWLRVDGQVTRQT